MNKIFTHLKEKSYVQFLDLYLIQIKTDGVNHELMQLYREPDIVRTTKINILRRLGHVQRMDENRVPKKLLKTKPEGKRSAGRPKSRWCDAAFANLRTIGVTSWETLAENRPGWRSMLQKAKTLNGL